MPFFPLRPTIELAQLRADGLIAPDSSIAAVNPIWSSVRDDSVWTSAPSGSRLSTYWRASFAVSTATVWMLLAFNASWVAVICSSDASWAKSEFGVLWVELNGSRLKNPIPSDGDQLDCSSCSSSSITGMMREVFPW
jgi:hypothetical protein